MLGAIAQFEKASLVAKLKAAGDRKRAREGKCEGRRSHVELNPELVAMVKRLRRRHPKTGPAKITAGDFPRACRPGLPEHSRRAVCRGIDRGDDPAGTQDLEPDHKSIDPVCDKRSRMAAMFTIAYRDHSPTVLVRANVNRNQSFGSLSLSPNDW
jgi:hypothetical protein